MAKQHSNPTTTTNQEGFAATDHLGYDTYIPSHETLVGWKRVPVNEWLPYHINVVPPQL